MSALDNRPEARGDPQITLGSVDHSTYYLLEGEKFLQQFLLVDGVFPRPVGCIMFKSVINMTTFLGGDVNIADLWQINPAIVDRLRKDNDLLEVDAPET